MFVLLFLFSFGFFSTSEFKCNLIRVHVLACSCSLLGTEIIFLYWCLDARVKVNLDWTEYLKWEGGRSWTYMCSGELNLSKANWKFKLQVQCISIYSVWNSASLSGICTRAPSNRSAAFIRHLSQSHWQFFKQWLLTNIRVWPYVMTEKVKPVAI